jgi:hypothetical protein
MKVHGRATIKVDGKILLNQRGAELDLGGEKRNPVVGSNSVHGYSAEFMAPQLTLTVSKRSDVNLGDLDAIENATILWEGDDGSRYVLHEAFRVDTVKLKEVNGEVPLTFSAMSCDPL